MITQAEVNERLRRFALQPAMIDRCKLYAEHGYSQDSIYSTMQATFRRVYKELLNADPDFHVFDNLNKRQLIALREIFSQCCPMESVQQVIEHAKAIAQQADIQKTDQISIQIHAISLDQEGPERKALRTQLIQELDSIIAQIPQSSE
jgi:hypothetical protein